MTHVAVCPASVKDIMEPGALIPAGGQSLRELQPLSPPELSQQLAPGVYAPLPAQDSVLREYLRVLIKRKFVVIACIVIIFLMVLVATLRMIPIYDAAGSIAINKMDLVDFSPEVFKRMLWR